MNQHPAAAARGVVNQIARTRLEDANKRVDDFRRREEFSGFRARIVGKLLDEIFVGAAKNICRHSVVGQVVLVEMRDEGWTTSFGISGLPELSGAG